MAGRFPQKDVDELLVKCHRRCCICHRFCGVKMEVDHIVPGSESGSDDITNAIPVCFECHAEIHSYNDKHPRGRKYHSAGLQGPKNQWLETCQRDPKLLFENRGDSDVGPLQAMIDELEFNEIVSDPNRKNLGCLFLDDQFLRAIREGTISTMNEDIKAAIMKAYEAIRRANHELSITLSHWPNTNAWETAGKITHETIIEVNGKTKEARRLLLQFLGTESS